jgi:peroxiredoxin
MIVLPQLPDIDFAHVGPSVGGRFPDVRLPDQSGEVVDLHDFRDGHRLLFVVHRSADW